jgi:hypothetical protein
MLRFTHSSCHMILAIISKKSGSINKSMIHTHGSFLSHFSFPALHREQDKVNLRGPGCSSARLSLPLLLPDMILPGKLEIKVVQSLGK